MKGRRKGTPKTGGRKKGTPNKVSGTLREWVTSFIEDNREQIQRDWRRLGPKDRVIMFEKLLRYSLPTLQSTSLEVGFENLPDDQLDEIIEKLMQAADQ